MKREFRILAAAIEAGARAVDVEIESAENALTKLDLLGDAQLIVSYHNYEGTPALEPLMRRMLKIPAAAYKIVTTARKPSDNLKLLSLLKAHSRMPLVLLAMSETGFPSRVLCTVLGGAFTYAAPSTAEGTAAGQVSARTLRHLYRIEKPWKDCKVFGVVADPVHHSISPAVHNRALQARRIAALYLPFLVGPLQLKDFFVFAARLPLQGFSVTIPHKQRIIRYLDALDPLSRRIGAVNTVWRKAGKWRGTNTDIDGVRVPLEKRIRLSKKSVLVAGNGGAARAAAFALADAGAKVSITGRNADRIRALAKCCGGEAVLPGEWFGAHYDILVHATPLGMWPHTEGCFFDGPIPADIVFDLVYNPERTMLLKRAAAEGLETIPGVEMFIEQAARQFEIFTGDSAPRTVMQQAAREALAEQSNRSSAHG